MTHELARDKEQLIARHRQRSTPAGRNFPVAPRLQGHLECPVNPLARWTIPPDAFPSSTPLDPVSHNFNGGCIEWQGKQWLAYRHGWRRAKVWLANVAADGSLNTNVKLDLPQHNFSRLGSEDPRPFVFRERLWVQSTGFTAFRPVLQTSLRFSQVSDPARGTIDHDIWPSLLPRHPAEKNWMPFEHRDRLLAVYECSPSIVVIEINPQNGAAHVLHDFGRMLPDSLGSWRGGASPVRVGDELWFVTHNQFSVSGGRFYAASLFTLAADTLEPMRYLDAPLYLPDDTQRWNESHPSVVFPCGAIVRDGRLIVSGGHQDRWQEFVEFDIAAIDSELRPIAGGGTWRKRTAVRISRPPNDSAAEVIESEYVNTTYPIPERLKAGDVCIDVGANVGPVSLRLWQAGCRNVIAVEPVPSTVDHLRRTFRRFGVRARIVEAAIGPECQQATTIHAPPGMSAHANEWAGNSPVVCATTTLKKVIGDTPKVRLLALDCEGCEHHLTPEDLERVTEIVGECHAVGGHDMASFRTVLHDAGFLVQDSKPGDTWIFHATRPPKEAATKKRGPKHGDRLAELLHRIGFDETSSRESLSHPETTSGCRCEQRRKQLNSWSEAEILARRDEVIGWLREAAERVAWWKKAVAMPLWVAEGLPITTDPPAAIFDFLWPPKNLS